MECELILCRCLAPPNDLDRLPINPRSKEHTATVVRNLELGEAWDEYGLIGDVVVRLDSVKVVMSPTGS